MNYLPIFSPVNGVVDSVNSTIIISMSDDQIALPTEISNVTISVDKNKCQIRLSSPYIPVVDKGTHVDAGSTIIGYFKIAKPEYYPDPKQLVVLTAPHFLCINNSVEKHTCDFDAERLAVQLKTSLESDNRTIYWYSGNINRSTTDLNRNAGFNTRFRKAIRNLVKMKIKEIALCNSKSNTIYILDCHSFPARSFPSIRISDPDVCILMANCVQLIYIDELVETFKDHGLLVTRYLGLGNDIIEEFYQFNHKYHLKKYDITIVPVLIEIKENISTEKLKNIGLSINKWILTIDKYLSSKD